MFFWMTNIAIILIYGCCLSKVKKQEVFLVLVGLHLGLILALRGVSVGTDTLNYSYAFNVIKNGSVLSTRHIVSSSKLFLETFKFFSFLPATRGYMILTAIPTITIIIFFIKEYSRNYLLSIMTFLFSYLFFYSMNASRHCLAISFIFLAYHLARKKRYVFSIAMFIIACMIHNAVSVFIIFYFIDVVAWNKKKLLVCTITFILGMKLMPFFIRLFVSIFTHYSWLLNKMFDKSYTSGGRSSMENAGISLVILIVWFVIELSNRKKILIKYKKNAEISNNINDDEMQNLYKLICLNVLCMGMFAFFPTSILITRSAYVFFAFSIITLPNCISLLGKVKIYIVAIIYGVMMITTYMQLAGNYSGVLNYNIQI